MFCNLKINDYSIFEKDLIMRFNTLKIENNISDEIKKYFRFEQCFCKNILKTLVNDICVLFNVGRFDRASCCRLLTVGKRVFSMGGFMPPEHSDPDEMFAEYDVILSVASVWIGFCTKYKNKDYPVCLPAETRGLLKNENVIQASIAAECFNCHTGYLGEKGNKIHGIFEELCGDYDKRSRTGRDESADIIALISAIRLLGFYYVGPNNSDNPIREFI